MEKIMYWPKRAADALKMVLGLEKECVFCKIVAGSAHGNKIYEDAHCIAILDLYPAADGHCLVIPKDHHADIFDTPPKTLQAIAVACGKVAVQLQKKLGCHGANIIQNSGKDAGQVVFHIHFHVIPRFSGDGINLKVGRSLGHPKSLEQMQEKLKF